MTRRVDAPHESQVRAALDELRQRAGDNGTQPSVLALASKFGMSNTTFRRHFPDIAQEIAALRAAPPTPGAPSEPTRYDRLVARNAKLKRHNRELTETFTLAACHIQRITLENQKLREALEAATGVARLTPLPSRRSASS
ncbi:hypothetical protein LXH13_37235 [Streptomyces spinosirectus]|jgi:hypothetical protein|uniref:hypothetical protein n=1 Tax=Streptomyces TaxID=1883 RepID=UPI000D355A01|nr:MULTISPECIES: hypothetical protein [Streptomyces]MBY8341049.1 hypothetical protein [Streptomyces plumbidurans]PTM89988.1 hypothetical protein C7821_112201 [Streptomyces sp. VMFN-G11Ma]UIR22341.1 hypothetical protein LXH13_37235 [Streptomyces spinosirectus]